MKPIINREMCIGCGMCENICPEVFKLNDGKSEVINLPDYTVFKEKIEQAKDSCPVQAIDIEE
ncbi:MAG: ferredoxin [Candidatus Parcubacteria bacterium]|nr:ferredoxin [Candidatus Parcubacteria bacterium]